MRKILLMIAIGLISCKSSPEKEFLPILKKRLEDAAFKDNKNLKIYEFSILDVENVNTLSVDSEYIRGIVNKANYYSKVMKSISEAQQATVNVSHIIDGGDRALVEDNLDKLKDYKMQAVLYNDSLLYLFKLDSIIRKEMVEKSNPELAYRVKAFLKGTVYSKQDSSNFLDTVYYYFDKNKNFIDMSKTPVR